MKIIQIAANEFNVYGLANDGSLWELARNQVTGEMKWVITVKRI